MKLLRQIAFGFAPAWTLLWPVPLLAQQPASTGPISVEVARLDKKKCHIPVAPVSGASPFILARVPGGIALPEGKATGYKIMARQEGDAVRVEFHAIFGDLNKITKMGRAERFKTAALQSLKTKLVDSFLLPAGETATPRVATRPFGARGFKIGKGALGAGPGCCDCIQPAPATGGAIEVQPSNSTPAPSTSSGGSLTCCPFPGECLTCNGCGYCCS